jgi:hypothetical protein
VALVENVQIDLGGQAVFEAGVLLWEMAFRRHPVHSSYPLSLSERAYDRDETCALPADEKTAATAVGYPMDAFSALVRDMVAMNPATRPSLAVARGRLEGMMSSTCVSTRLPEYFGMTRCTIDADGRWAQAGLNEELRACRAREVTLLCACNGWLLACKPAFACEL